MEKEPDLEFENSFVCKSKVCVICALRINDDDDNNQITDDGLVEGNPQHSHISAQVCPDIFLRGILVFCETLNIEQKYTNCKEWTAPGVDNFVKMVCCGDCYRMFENLVTLYEVITSTQATLEEDVHKLKDNIFKSQETAKDVEYSINTCLKFRDHILKKATLPAKSLFRANISSKLSSSYFRLRRRLYRKQSKSRRLESLRKTKRSQRLNPVFNTIVKTEPLESEETEQCQRGNDNDVHSDVYMLEEGNNSCDHDFQSAVCGEDDKGTAEDTEYPSLSQSQIIPRKRGRPRKILSFNIPEDTQINNNMCTMDGDKMNDCQDPFRDYNGESNTSLRRDSPRKRGRPRKILPTNAEPVVKRKRGRPRKLPIPDENMPVVKRKRGRPRKHSHLEADDDDYCPKESAVKKRKNLHSKHMIKQSRKFWHKDRSNSMTRKRGRPIDHSKIVSECSKRIAIFVISISQGEFMYLNVKFQRVQETLLCKHPDCSHTVLMKGYFTDQAAYTSMRLHIRNVHRKKYKLVGEPDRKKCYFCSHCALVLKSRPELLMHRKNLHAEAFLPLTLCEICGDIMQHQAIFRHLLTHKNDEEKALVLAKKQPPKQPIVRRKVKSSSKITYPCNQCSKVFRTKSQQEIHIQSHIPIELRKIVICDICGDRVSSINNLKLHKKTVHFRDEMRTAFECHICGKTFLQTEKIRFHTHLNAHTGERPFQCTQCGKGFFAKWNLSLHERSHLQTAVTCEYCPKVFKSEKYLKRHQAVHHSNLISKSPKCTARRYIPPRREEFVGPKLMHPCEPCNRVFLYKSMLVKHLKEKHKLFLPKSDDYPNQVTLEIEDMKWVAESS